MGVLEEWERVQREAERIQRQAERVQEEYQRGAERIQRQVERVMKEVEPQRIISLVGVSDDVYTWHISEEDKAKVDATRIMLSKGSISDDRIPVSVEQVLEFPSNGNRIGMFDLYDKKGRYVGRRVIENGKTYLEK